ncbi:metallophosphoesterase [Sulfurifustis variabilis]|uniref:Metallophosphoesterase n=1 Tax=Sulfurifustis variabilis TaxID=1675686 RepID=A0A1B4V124_9GAMM|nr:metallophosphoesterase [Sulfurifustis variabilis]BAU47176.1 metallophosphoesterase [Sulfurifustis variabilis]
MKDNVTPLFDDPADAQTASEADGLAALESRVGRVHLRQRLGLEADYEERVFRFGTHFFHLENWYSVHALIRNSLRLVGLHGRGRRNARAVVLRENEVALEGLPAAFDGYRVLQISDPHLDMSEDITDAVIERVRGLEYDLCVMTGDYRARTFGPYQPTLAAMARVREHLRGTIAAVLGNHDTIRMVPGLEAMGIRVLLNESMALARDDAEIHLAGIDDAHYYRLDNFEKAAARIPSNAFSILLSHTPETYKHAGHAGFRLMLCGHTHGGQICLPGGLPVITDADCPRRYVRGPWRYHSLIGYTSTGSGSSIVDVRLNCPPEVTLHRLRAI